MARLVFSLFVFLAIFTRAGAQTVPQTTTTLDTRSCQPPHDGHPFCDVTLPVADRVNDLIARLWANASSIPFQLTARNFGQSAVPALGLPEFDWGLNAIHGVQSSCVATAAGATFCPTSFMNPVNFGNSWNKSLARELGSIIGVEARALWLAGAVEQSPRNHIGLTTWSPNINVARDPRWGRNQEVCGEDPLLNGDFGSQYTLGLQQGVDATHLQAVVTLKHWDAYSLEDAGGFTRHNFNAIVSPYALASTYFPAFRKAVQEGGATGVMCSYNALNGVPTCASAFLNDVLRNKWGFKGYSTSDSGALEDIYTQHHYANDSLHSVRPALVDGVTDVCSGKVYEDSLLPALAAGLIAKADVELALRHTLTLRMQLGLFDPPSPSNPYWSVPLEAVGTPASAAANLLATQSSMVLLKHDGKTLPLPIGRNIVVIGPHGNATMALVGNYLGQLCPDNKFNCIVSPLQALAAANVGGATTWVQGCDLTKAGEAGFPAAIAAAQAADIVVLALGIDLSVEGEAHDRANISLTGSQHALAVAIGKVGKPTAMFILRGGVVDIGGELANAGIGAILDAGYPGFLGGGVIADTLLGRNDHLGGKLAQTMYANTYCAQINSAFGGPAAGRGPRRARGPRLFYPPPNPPHPPFPPFFSDGHGA